jgi:glyoxylase-like metal-dependent hydrolase (beta-lactamase superfamily II)
MPSISVLKPGSLIRDSEGNLLDARSSVTLVTAGSMKIIVDTGIQGEEGRIIKALSIRGLEPEDIDTVINTHSHLDHCGNNYLFTGARHLKPVEGETIAPGVQAIATPGHTIDSISVVVDSESWGVIVIAGDALPTFNNFLKNVPPALHVDRDLAVSCMARIIEMANIIIPGHDEPFSVVERKYIQLAD